MFYNKNNGETKQRFGIRKLTIGACSVLLSTLIFTWGNGQTVQADVNGNVNDVTTEKVESNGKDNAAEEGEQAHGSSAAVNVAEKSADTSGEDSAAGENEQTPGSSVADSATGNSNNAASAESGIQSSADASDGETKARDVAKSNEENATSASKKAYSVENASNNGSQTESESSGQPSSASSEEKSTGDTANSASGNNETVSVSVADLARDADLKTLDAAKSELAETATKSESSSEGITKNSDGSTTYTPVKGADGKWQAPENTPEGLELTKYVTATLKTNVPDGYRNQVPATQSFSKDFYRTATVDDNGKVTYSDWVLDGGLDAQGNATTWKFGENQTTNFYFPFDKSALPSAYGADNTYDWESSITDLPKTDNPNGGDHIQGFDGTKYGIRTWTVGQLPTDITITVNWSNQQTYEYVDVDDNNTPVGDTATVSGLINSTGTVNLPALPENYELVSGQDFKPGEANTVTITSAPTVQIKLQHKTKTYGIIFDSAGDPVAQKGTPDDIVDKMTKTTTIGIKVSGAPESAGVNGDYTFAKHFYRTATTDLVTGKTTYGSWKLNGGLHADGSAVDVYTFTGADNFYFPTSVKDTNSLLPGEDSGYTKTETETITPDGYQWPNGVTHNIGPYSGTQAYRIYHATVDQLPTSVITDIVWEKAYPVTINYVDGNNVVATDTIKDALDDKVNIPQTLPTEVTDKGYKLADGETIPETYTIQADNNTITIKLAHQTQAVTQKGTSTYVEHYHYWKDGEDAGQATADNEVQVGYKRSGIEDLVTKNVTPTGDWTLDTSFGDNGYQIVSGTWTPSDGSVTVTPPTLDGYTAITTSEDKQDYTKFTVSAPTDGTTSTSSQTVYYVPNSDLSGTMTRVVNIIYNGNSQSPITQSINWTRTGYITTSDDGVELGGTPQFQGYTPGSWTSPSGEYEWQALNRTNSILGLLPLKVIGVATTTYTDSGEKVSGPTVLTDLTVPQSEELNPSTTKNETVTVTIYDKTMDIGLSGEYDDTYNGQSAAIPSDIVAKVTSQITANSAEAVKQGWMTEPDTSKVQLTTSDFSFADDQGNIINIIDAPTNAGTYHIILNSDGLAKFENLDSSFNWNYDPTTAYATLTINPAPIKLELKGQDEKIYDGQVATTSLTTGDNGNVTVTGKPDKGATIDLSQLPASDFVWKNADGQTLDEAPVNVGTYTVTLSEQALTDLAKTNPNYTFTSDGSYTYVINPATEKVTIEYVDPSGKVVKTDDSQEGKVGEDLTLQIPSQIFVDVATPVEGLSALPYNLAPAKYQSVTIDSANDNNTVVYKVTDADNQTVKIQVYQPHMNIVYWNDTTNTEITSHYFINKPTYSVSGYDPRIPFPTDFNKSDYTCVGVTGAPAGLKILGNYDTPLKTYDSTNWDIPNFSVESGYDENELNYELSLDTTKLVFHLAQKAHQTYQFVDADENNIAVGDSITVNGIVGEDLKIDDDKTFKIPNNYELQSGTSLPTSVKLSADSTTIDIPLVHKTQEVTETGISTYVEHYNYWKDGADGGQAQPDSELQVGYKRTNTKDLVTNKITKIGEWNIDTSFGTNGYKTVSGTWTNADNVTKVTVPTIADYTAVTETVDGQNLAQFTIAAPSTGTSSTTGRTIYYVSTSALSTNVDRTINYYLGDATTPASTDTQKTQFSRTANVNNDGTGVVFNAWNTTTGGTNTWSSVDLTNKYPGYVPTIDGKVTDTIAEVTVDPSKDTDQTINVVYIKQAANIGLTGTYTNTYNGSASAIPADVVNKVTETLVNPDVTTLPDLSNLGLTTADFSFADENGNIIDAPTNVGTYHIILNQIGLDAFKAVDKNFTWNYDPTKAYATYTITAAQPTATVSGTYTTTYTGSGVLTNGLTDTGITLRINTNGATPSPTYKLVDGDYEFVPDKGEDAVKNPVDAGTYNVVLTDQGKKNISALTDNGNYKWLDKNMSSVAQIVIGKANATAVLGGDVEKTYDGTPITGFVPTLTITAPGNPTYTLKSGDYEFIPQAGGTATQTAPSNAGTYIVQLTQQGIDNIKKLNADNLNWGSITGTGRYIIDKANATITLPASSSQTATWTGSTPTIDPSKFVPTISTNNGVTITVPSSVNLTASDYEIVDDSGKQIEPTEIGTYKVRLTDAGWQKIENAVDGNANYNWNYAGTGTLNITKADATVSLSGAGSAMYNGSAIVLNKDNLGTIKVTLSNGETYNVTSADLQFVDGAPINVGNYTGKIELSPAGIAKLAGLDSTHYNYKYDNSKANFEVTKATATYQLTGDQSKVYDGQPGSLTANGHYQVNITTNNGQQLTYTLTNDDIEFDTEDNVAPTNHGVYKVKLTQTGIDHLQALNSNYNWNEQDSTATYDIKQAEMTVNLTGTASTVFNNQEQPLTQDQVDKLQLTWAGSTTVPGGLKSVGLTPDDIEYLEKVDGTWQVMSGAPIHATKEGESPYGIRLTEAGLEKVQNANKDSNYTFVLGKEVQATYTIDQLKAQVTLKGYQTAPYTKNVALDPSNFQVYLTNTSDNVDINVSDNQYDNHKLVAGDLVIEGYENSLPSEVGSYKVKVTDQLINALKLIFPDYDFDAYNKDNPGVSAQDDNPSVPGSAVTNNSKNTDVAASNNDGKYIITPIDAFIKITGHQTIKYGESDDLKVGEDGYTVTLTDTYGNVIKGFTLTPSDLEFVTKNYNIVDPKNVGNYEVTLTKDAMDKIDAIGKNSLGNMNYSWINQFTPATFTVEKMPVTITVGDKSSDTHPTIIYGQATTLNPSDYIISVETENGKTLDYTLQAGDLAFEKGTPTTTGTFDVVLSPEGLKNIEDKYGTQNYTYSQTGNGLFTINSAKPTVAISGQATQVYNGQAIPDYTVTATVTGPETDQTVTLSGNDLKYVEDGQTYTTAPVNVGDYTVQLTDAGKKKIAAVNAGNLDWKDFAWTNIGTPTYQITKATATVTTNGTQIATYTGNPIEFDVSQFTSSVSTNNGLTLTIPTSDLTASDYVITDKDGKEVTDPTNVGTYTVKLTADGLKKLESQTDNYDWVNAGQGTLTITQATPIVSINAEASKVYNGSAIVGYAPKVTINAPGATAVALTTGDFEFKVDGKWTTVAPVNAGDYEVQLTEAGLNKIKAVNSANLDWNGFTPTIEGDYSISKANAVISLNDRQKQLSAYTGKSAAIDPADFVPEVEDTSNNKLLTAENLNLTANDYEFVGDDGQVISPSDVINAGTYKVRLTAAGAKKVEAAVANNSNYNWTNEGTGLYVIDMAVPTITITANTGKNGKIYDGKPGEISSDGYTVTVKNSDGDVVTTLDGSALQFTDDETPTNVGNYKVELTPYAIDQLKKDYPNYNWDNAGDASGEYDITPFDVTITTDGSDWAYQGSVEIHAGTYSLKTSTKDLPKGFEMPTGNFGFDGGTTPTKVGTYSVNFVGGQAELQKLLGDNYKVTYTPATDNFKVVSNKKTGTVSYVDSSTGKTISNKEISGTIGGTAEVNAQDGVPAGWKIADGQTGPDTVPVTENGIDPVTIKIEHDTITVTPQDPKKPGDKLPDGTTTGKDYPDGDHYPEGVAKDDLNKTVTRTIIEKLPSGNKTTTQTATITRDATVDLVTGEVTYGDWSTGKWDAFTPEKVAGYTASQTSVAKVSVTGTTTSTTITVNYTADPQNVTIKFVDTQNNDKVVDSIVKNGVTDQTIKLGLAIPAGYALVEGQTLPQSYKFTSDKDQTITIKLDHQTIEVTPDDPETPSDIIPNTDIHYPSGVSKKDLVKTVTRTINVTNPITGKVTTIKQETKFNRTATVDLVTDKVTYTDWTQAGNNGWTEYTPTAISGYTVETVPGEDVTAETADTAVNVSYTPDEIPQPTPTPESEQNTHTIVYVDGNGKKIGRQVISGTDGSTIQFIPSYPNGYKPADGQTIPDSVTMDGGITRIVVVSDKGNGEPTPAPLHPGKNDEPGKPQNPENPTEPNKQNKPGEKPAANNSSTTSTAKPASTIVSPKATNKEAAGWKISREVVASQKNKQSNHEETLPQTGEKDDTWIAAIGSLLAGLGIFGLAIDKHKKKDKD